MRRLRAGERRLGSVHHFWRETDIFSWQSIVIIIRAPSRLRCETRNRQQDKLGVVLNNAALFDTCKIQFHIGRGDAIVYTSKEWFHRKHSNRLRQAALLSSSEYFSLLSIMYFSKSFTSNKLSLTTPSTLLHCIRFLKPMIDP